MKTAQGTNLRRLEQGLTFGEMLIVLAVFSILTIMFFLSSSHAIVKTRLSRVVQEEKTLTRALASYEADFSDIPSQTQGLDKLKGPIAYLANIPNDPFTEAGRTPIKYLYVRGLSAMHRCLIVSVGPDGVADFQAALDDIRQKKPALAAQQGQAPLLNSAEAQDMIARYSYDPTNGTTSQGDVITIYGQ